MKYFRSYPWTLQLILLLLMVFVFMFFGSAIVQMIVPNFTPYTIDQVRTITPASPPALIRVATLVNAALSLFSMLLPAFIFASLAHPRPFRYLGLRPAQRKINYLLPALIMIGALPLLLELGNLMSHLPLSPAVKAEQVANDNMFSAMLNTTSWAGLIKMVLITAVLVPIGEEMFFRGLMMRFAKQRSSNMYFPAIFSALVFAFAHANYTGALSIFISGLLLASFYYLTGTLWASIIAHATFNGSQVLISYLGNKYPSLSALAENNALIAVLLIGGAALFSVSFYLLWKNKTPLPATWSNDFTSEEIAANAS